MYLLHRTEWTLVPAALTEPYSALKLHVSLWYGTSLPIRRGACLLHCAGVFLLADVWSTSHRALPNGLLHPLTSVTSISKRSRENANRRQLDILCKTHSLAEISAKTQVTECTSRGSVAISVPRGFQTEFTTRLRFYDTPLQPAE